jgi:hypothetical protein
MLGGNKGRSDPDGFGTRAAFRCGMSKDTVKSLGSTLETWDTKLLDVSMAYGLAHDKRHTALLFCSPI